MTKKSVRQLAEEIADQQKQADEDQAAAESDSRVRDGSVAVTRSLHRKDRTANHRRSSSQGIAS